MTRTKRLLINLLPEKIKSAKVTAQWENHLAEITNGNDSADQFIKETKNEISELVESFSNFKDTGLLQLPKKRLEIVQGVHSFFGRAVHQMYRITIHS